MVHRQYIPTIDKSQINGFDVSSFADTSVSAVRNLSYPKAAMR